MSAPPTDRKTAPAPVPPATAAPPSRPVAAAAVTASPEVLRARRAAAGGTPSGAPSAARPAPVATTATTTTAAQQQQQLQQQQQQQQQQRAARARERVADDKDSGTELCLAVLFVIGLSGVAVFLIGGRLGLGFGGGGGGGVEDPFGLGGGGQQRRMHDIKLVLRVGLDSAHNGDTIDVNYPDGHQTLCDACHGSGGAPGDGGVVTCPKCHGRGAEEFRVQVAPGFYQTMRQTCSACGGRGQLIRRVCPKCRGARVLMHHDHDLSIAVPRGCPEGHVVTIKGAGHQMPGAATGDVVVTVYTDAHPRFVRSEHGTDLTVTLPLTLKQALLGFDIPLTLLDGRVLHITPTPPNTVTTPDTVLHYAGYGMPAFVDPTVPEPTLWERLRGVVHTGASRPAGDLHVRFRIAFPAVVTPKQRDELVRLLGPLPDD